MESHPVDSHTTERSTVPPRPSRVLVPTRWLRPLPFARFIGKRRTGYELEASKGSGPSTPKRYYRVHTHVEPIMGYEGFRDYYEKEMILTVATTGGLHGKDANPNLPEQPDEIAADVEACEEAGAAMVHLHARDENGDDTKDPERWQMMRDAIDDRCDDIIVNFTTGGGYPREERLRPILETDPRPDVATIDVGPLNFGKETVRDYCRGQNEEFAEAMRDHGVKPELETFSPGHFTEVHHLVDEGYLEEPYWLTLILGMQTGTIPTPRNLLNLVDNIPDGAEWQCLAVGRYQLPLTTMAITLGGHVRVGMEDNVYYRKGELVESNAQLVERTARIADELERPLATPDRAREILGIDG